jgi:hypothetical protein
MGGPQSSIAASKGSGEKVGIRTNMAIGLPRLPSGKGLTVATLKTLWQKSHFASHDS